MGNANYVSLSLATALQRSMDVAAHNMANASTAGFKASRPLFESVDPSGAADPDEAVNYVQDRGTYVDTSQGALIATGNPLDLAVSGGGWFGYQAEGGQTAYGRDGRLTIDADGQLATLAGAPIIDLNGSPVTLPSEVGQAITIARDGTITDSAGATLGQIGVFRIEDVDSMTAIGNGLYLTVGGAGQAVPDDGSQVVQGSVEQSNVQPVVELTRLMDIQRAYERAVKLMNDENELTRQAIQRLGRVV